MAGEGYGYYLARSWQVAFDTPLPYKPCETLTVNGQRVGLLTLKTYTPASVKFTCSEPAGRSLYAVSLSNECSTFKGDHGKFGTGDAQLMKCARALFKGAQESLTVDGHAVNVAKLLAATGVYPVRLPKHHKGTHVIHAAASIVTSKWTVTYTVHVR